MKAGQSFKLKSSGKTYKIMSIAESTITKGKVIVYARLQKDGKSVGGTRTFSEEQIEVI